jgi:lipopolysaccharide export system permease protein
MTILDRYFSKQLLLPLVFCSLALIFLVYMSDLFNHLDQMVKNKTPLLYILKYYAALLPQTFVSIISWSSLLAVIFVLTTFNFHNELTAMKVAGLEISSIIRPIILFGFILGIFTFIVNDQVVPRTAHIVNQIKFDRIEKKMNTEDSPSVFENVTYYGGRERLYYVRRFDAADRKMEDLIILWLDAQKNVKKKTVAREATWNGAFWDLHHCTDYNLERGGKIMGEPVYREFAKYEDIRESPDEFARAANREHAISYRDLKDYIIKLKDNGVKLTTENVILHYKLASPWQSLIVMFLTVPLLARTSTRKLMALNVMMCLAFIIIFHLSGAVLLALGKAGKIFPLMSAWTHTVVFSFGAYLVLDFGNR